MWCSNLDPDALLYKHTCATPTQGLEQNTGGVYIWKYEKVRRNGRGGWENVQVRSCGVRLHECMNIGPHRTLASLGVFLELT